MRNRSKLELASASNAKNIDKLCVGAFVCSQIEIARVQPDRSSQGIQERAIRAIKAGRPRKVARGGAIVVRGRLIETSNQWQIDRKSMQHQLKIDANSMKNRSRGAPGLLGRSEGALGRARDAPGALGDTSGALPGRSWGRPGQSWEAPGCPEIARRRSRNAPEARPERLGTLVKLVGVAEHSSRPIQIDV